MTKDVFNTANMVVMTSIFILLRKKVEAGKIVGDDNVIYITFMYVPHITREGNTQWWLTSNDT